MISNKRDIPAGSPIATGAGRGQFIDSVVDVDAQGEPLAETFYYWKNGVAFGYKYGGLSPVAAYQTTFRWSVPSAQQLREWVQLEQIAAGLFRAAMRQRQPTGQVPVKALLRLRTAARQAITQAACAAGAPKADFLRTPIIDCL